MLNVKNMHFSRQLPCSIGINTFFFACSAESGKDDSGVDLLKTIK